MRFHYLVLVACGTPPTQSSEASRRGARRLLWKFSLATSSLLGGATAGEARVGPWRLLQPAHREVTQQTVHTTQLP